MTPMSEHHDECPARAGSVCLCVWLRERDDDAQRARDEGDEQRDYAEERYNARLLKEQ